MSNFGVLEVASARRSVAPGWAYVPDTPVGFGSVPAATSANAGASNRKRAVRNQAGAGLASYSDLTSRQQAKLLKELEVLDRDGGAVVGPRDATIPVPAKAVKAQNKHTPTVRKILASQKTFANHLDDFLAMTALHENGHGHGHGHNDGTASGRAATAAAAAASVAATATTAETAATPVSGRGKRAAKKEAAKRESKKRQSVSATTTSAEDTPMPDATASEVTTAGTTPAATTTTTTPAPSSSSILRPYTGPRPTPTALDGDPLLVSYMPPLPTDDELRALLEAPPLTYAEARATWPEADGTGSSAPERRYPARVFCEICGYWGRVKCTKCGTPLCALDCLEMHREDCITRYGL